MDDFINFISLHWDDVIIILGILLSLTRAIVKLTPTQEDDKILAKIISFLDVFFPIKPTEK